MPKGGCLAIAALLGLTMTAGCASGDRAEPPAWFKQREKELRREGYPRLANIPDRVDANVNQTHWDEVRTELDADAAAMRASPRSEAPPTADAQEQAATAFEEKARGDLEATRAQH